MLKAVAIVVAITVALGTSGIAWYMFSSPPVQHLALTPDLIDGMSVQGGHLLAESPAKTDYDQLNPYFESEKRRAFCGVASSIIVINAALSPQPQVTQDALFTPAAAAVRSELAVSFSG